jgi:hypothetical protein
MLSFVSRLKTEGNELFQQKNFTEAVAKYTEVSFFVFLPFFQCISILATEQKNAQGEEKVVVNENIAVISSNLAETFLKVFFFFLFLIKAFYTFQLNMFHEANEHIENSLQYFSVLPTDKINLRIKAFGRKARIAYNF